jgi:iron complex outermembrane receptor protein
LFTTLFFWPLIVIAEDGYISETDYFEDVQTVVSATRLKQKVTDAPVSVTIIDSEMIAASGATEIYELLRFVPGYFSYSVWGSQVGVSSHFQPTDVGTRLEVQVNGRSIYEPLFSAVDWMSLGIDLDDIDYIEVVRGSSATTYGSNAFLGAINIITKDVLSRPKASIRTTIGNIGLRNVTVNHSGNFKDIDYGLSLVHRSNTGFAALDTISRPRDLSSDDRESLQLSLQGLYVSDLNNQIEFDVGLGRSDLQIPTAIDSRGYSNRDHENNYQRIKWIHKSKHSEESVQFYHNYLKLRDDLSLGLLSDVIGVSPAQVSLLFPGNSDENIFIDNDSGFSQRYDLEFEQKKVASDYIKFVWGAGFRQDRVKSQYFFGDGVKSEERYRVFGNIDWKLNQKLNTNIGLFAEKTDSTELVYSPRLALNFHPQKNHTIRASIVQGSRIPSVTDTNVNTSFHFSNNSPIDTLVTSVNDLSEEKVRAFEIAYIAKFPKIKTEVDIKFFREEMKDFIYGQTRPSTDLDGEVRVLDNLSNLTTKGLELQLNHKVKAIPDLNLRLSYAYLETSGTVIKDIRDPSNTVEASALPRHSGTLMLTKKLANQYNLSGILQYQSDYQNRRVGFKRVDLRLGKKLKLSNTQGELSFVIQNAFNKYKDFSSRNEFKTRAYVQLKLDF